MRLFSYWRSTTSYRVRIALNLKQLSYEYAGVNLVTGEQCAPDYVALNPGRSVPTLQLDDGTVITQSIAILEWIDEVYAEPALLPKEPRQRAKVRAACQCIAADIHPINNMRVTARLKAMGHSQEEVVDWMNDWMGRGFAAFAGMIAADEPFCFGETPGMADLCLVSQLYNAHRWGVDLSPFSRLQQIEENCLKLAAFDRARPENQPDAA